MLIFLKNPIPIIQEIGVSEIYVFTCFNLFSLSHASKCENLHWYLFYSLENYALDSIKKKSQIIIYR